MPADPRLETAFRLFERTLDFRHRATVGEMGCTIVAEELVEAIDAAGPDAEIEDPTGIVWVVPEDTDEAG